MGNARMVRVIAQCSGIIMVNGRTGEVPKGTILDVDPITAHDYDFLEVIPPKPEVPKSESQNVVEQLSDEVEEVPQPSRKKRGSRKKNYDPQDIP